MKTEITPEMRRELLAAWDKAVNGRWSDAVGVKEYELQVDALHLAWRRAGFRVFDLATPGLAAAGV